MRKTKSFRAYKLKPRITSEMLKISRLIRAKVDDKIIEKLVYRFDSLQRRLDIINRYLHSYEVD